MQELETYKVEINKYLLQRCFNKKKFPQNKTQFPDGRI